MSVLSALFSSRKFVLGLVAICALVPLVALKTMSIQQFSELYKWIVVTILGGIAVEGAAEKWNAPPIEHASMRADSLRPAPPAASDLKTPSNPMRPPPMPILVMLVVLALLIALVVSLAGCVKGASVQQDPNGGVDACVEVARRCNCNLDGGPLADVGFGR